MNIQELLGDAYKDGMTIDEINAAIADKKFVDTSALPPTVPKSQFDTTASELSTAKKKIKEMQNANLTDSEKLQAAQQAAEDAKKEYQRKSTMLDVEKVFVDGGLKEDDYKELIGGIVVDDADVSIANAKSIVALVQAQRKGAENDVKKSLQSSIQKPKESTSNGNKPPRTKEEILKIKDPVERQEAWKEYYNQERT